MFVWNHRSLGNRPKAPMPRSPHMQTPTRQTPTPPHTCGSMGRWMGGVRAGCMPPLLKDSERGGREGSEMRLDTLCCSAGELCLFSLDRSSTWDRSHTTVIHSPALSTTKNPCLTHRRYDLSPAHSSLQATRQSLISVGQQPQCGM